MCPPGVFGQIEPRGPFSKACLGVFVSLTSLQSLKTPRATWVSPGRDPFFLMSETEPESEPNPNPTCATPTVDQKAHVQAMNNMADDSVTESETESESEPKDGARLRPHAHHAVRRLNLFVS